MSPTDLRALTQESTKFFKAVELLASAELAEHVLIAPREPESDVR